MAQGILSRLGISGRAKKAAENSALNATATGRRVDKKQLAFDLPIVIRLTGTNEELAVEILEGAGFSALTDMDEAVQKAVQLAQEAA